MKMRTMSLYESCDSTGDVSITDVDSSNTGIKDYAILSGIGLILVLVFVKFRAKNVISKI